MKSLEGSVAYLVTNIAANTPDFLSFSADDIQNALEASGYIELELSRHTYGHNGS